MTEAVWIAIIVQSSVLLGLIIKAIMDYRAKKAGNNPHPCAAHEKWLKELDDKMDEQGKELSRLGQSVIDTNRRLVRIEGMLNGTYRK